MPLTDMLDQRTIFVGCLFGAVSVLAYAIFGLLVRSDASRLRRRLRGPDGSGRAADETATVASAKRGGVSPLMDRITKAAAGPLMPKQREEQSRLRKRLGYAGVYSPAGMHIFVGSKIVLLCCGALAGLVIGSGADSAMLAIWLVCMLGVLGMALPGMWLSYRIRRRQSTLQASLPDALDLMVVCVEAGLTIDAAIQRVGQEIALAHPEIATELGITHMETRIGLSRVDALRNLGHRTGSAALQSLAAMLVQAERFGTSIGTALRVHAESLRVKRQHAAEEQAAKTTVKLAFPVVLFIFPTVVAVLGGPAFILFFKSPLFSGAGVASP
jgi:tight adherence protein C